MTTAVRLSLHEQVLTLNCLYSDCKFCTESIYLCNIEMTSEQEHALLDAGWTGADVHRVATPVLNHPTSWPSEFRMIMWRFAQGITTTPMPPQAAMR